MDEPWDYWTKDQLPRGFAYPVREQDVRAELHAANLKIGTVRLILGLKASWASAAEAPYLVAVDRPGDVADRIGARLFAGPPAGMVSIWACPSNLKKTIGELMRDEVLPRTCAWLQAVPSWGEGWAASNHRFTVQWRDGDLIVREDDRA